MANVVEIIVRAVDRTKSGLTSPIRNLDDLGKSIAKLTPAFAIMGTAAAASFLALSRSAINSADDIGKAAQSAGTATNSFSTMAYAADQSSLSQEQLSGSFKKLNLFINEANKGSEKNIDILNQLGVAYKNSDGTLRSADAVMQDVADRFADTADGAGKTSAAVALLGKSGADAIPFLNQGGAAIRELQDEARAFGQEVSGQTAKDAEAFNDNLTKLTAAGGGVVKMFVAGILPTLVQYSNAIVKSAKESGIFSAIAATLVDIFKYSVATVGGAVLIFRELGRVIGVGASILYDFLYGITFNGISIIYSLGENIVAVVRGILSLGESAGRVGEILYHFFTGNFSEAWNASKSTVAEMRDTILKVGQDIATAWEVNGKISGDVLNRSWENIKAQSKMLSGDIKADLQDFSNFVTNLFKKPIQGPEMGQAAASKPQLNLIDNEKLRKEAAAAEKIYAEMISNMAKGSEKIFLAEDARYAKRKEQIEKEITDEEEKFALLQTAEQEHAEKLAEIHSNFLALKAEKDLAYNEGNLAMSIAWLESEAQAAQYQLEGKQALIDTYSEMHRVANKNMYDNMATVANSFYQSFSNHVTNAILGTESWGKAFKAIGTEIIATVVRIAVQYVASRIVMFAIEKSGLAAHLVASLAAAASTAAAWAPAAALVSLASFGGNSAPASAGILATSAVSQSVAAMSVLGVAHDGLDYVPREGTYLLDEGEGVLKKEDNEGLQSLLEGGGSGGGMSNIILMLDGEIIGRVLGKLARDGRMTIPESAIAMA